MLKNIIVPVAAAILVSGPISAQAAPMSGAFTVHYNTQVPHLLRRGWVRIDSTGVGINRSPGLPLDFALVTLSDSAWLRKGRGRVKGTVTFTTLFGSLTSSYRGRVATDAAGHVTSRGRFHTQLSTYALAGVRGGGTYATAFSTPADFVTSWSGDLTPPGL